MSCSASRLSKPTDAVYRCTRSLTGSAKRPDQAAVVGFLRVFLLIGLNAVRIEQTGAVATAPIHFDVAAVNILGHFSIVEMALDLGEHGRMRPERNPPGGFPLEFK
jgi:hypothetical protein